MRGEGRVVGEGEVRRVAREEGRGRGERGERGIFDTDILSHVAHAHLTSEGEP